MQTMRWPSSSLHVRLSALAWVGRIPKMLPLHTVRSCVSSCLKFNFLISSARHSFHVFLPLPLPRSPVTVTFLHPDTQSSAILHSTCPNHLKHPWRTMSDTLTTPSCLDSSFARRHNGALPTTFKHNNNSLFLSSSLDFLSLRVTPQSTHPSYHYVLRSFQPLHVLHLRCPCLATICHHTLYTCTIQSFLHL